MDKIKAFFHNRLNTAIFIVFILMFILNCLAVPTSDDFRYSINSGFLDIFAREYNQYMTWTGRSTAHIIARTFLMMPKIIFNLCNSACFAYLAWILNVNGTGTVNVDSRKYMFTALLLFLTVPFFGQTVLWETGSCNYLWTAAIIFTFLSMYTCRERNSRKLNIFLMFLFGVLAGWTNENTGGALIMMVCFVLVFRRTEHQKNPLWMYAGLAGCVIGLAVMVLAPGNSVRGADFSASSGYAYELIHAVTSGIKIFVSYPGQLIEWILLAVLTALFIVQNKDRRVLKYALAYTVCGVAAVYAMTVTHIRLVYDRSMFGSTLFLICAVIMLADQISFDEGTEKKAAVVLLSAMYLFSAFRYVYTCADLTYTRYLYTKREKWVADQKNAGNLNPVVPQLGSEFMTAYNPITGLGDLSIWYPLIDNTSYAQLKGLESVTGTTYEKWASVYMNGDPYYMNIMDLNTYVDALLNDQNKAVLITSTKLNDAYEEHMKILDRMGVTPDNGIYADIYVSGEGVVSEGSESFMTIRDHAFYVSGNSDPVLNDVVIDNIEYTNDNEGITIVVFDFNTGTVSDSVTWNAQEGMRGFRYYKE